MTEPAIVAGGLYWVADDEVVFPSESDARTLHDRRMVLVLSGPKTNSRPDWPTVLVAPISSRTSFKTPYCVKLAAGEANVSKKCWARIPAVQPLLKSVLEDHVGVLPGEKLTEVHARLYDYLGLATEGEPGISL